MPNLKPVDHAALGTNQAVIILLLLAAFIFNQPLLVGAVAMIMLAGTALAKPGFFWVYTRALKPSGLVKPDLIPDNPEPHRFAQGFGGTVVLAGFLALLSGASVPGWALVWLVIALAALNLFAGFCAGCAMYYWFNRIHMPGFAKAPPGDTFPGLRPHKSNR